MQTAEIGKTYCISTWTLTLSEVQTGEVSWLNQYVVLVACCFLISSSNWLEVISFRHVVINSILHQFQMQFLLLSSTCWDCVSFLYGSRVTQFLRVTSHISASNWQTFMSLNIWQIFTVWLCFPEKYINIWIQWANLIQYLGKEKFHSALSYSPHGRES